MTIKEFGLGEDMPDAPKGRLLLIEMVPSTSWGANLRSELKRADWDKLRKQTYRGAGYKCIICGGVGPRWPVECHEIWEYDDEQSIQTLVGLEALCPACHEVKHFGRAFNEGNGGRAAHHLKNVNGWDRDRTNQHIRDAFVLWQDRSSKKWTLNLDWLKDHGVSVP